MAQRLPCDDRAPGKRECREVIGTGAGRYDAGGDVGKKEGVDMLNKIERDA